MPPQLSNVPELEGGWVNLTEAAEILGITRQHAYKRAKLTDQGKRGGFRTLHRIGSKSFYVVNRAELDAELQAKAERESSN